MNWTWKSSYSRITSSANNSSFNNSKPNKLMYPHSLWIHHYNLLTLTKAHRNKAPIIWRSSRQTFIQPRWFQTPTTWSSQTLSSTFHLNISKGRVEHPALKWIVRTPSVLGAHSSISPNSRDSSSSITITSSTTFRSVAPSRLKETPFREQPPHLPINQLLLHHYSHTKEVLLPSISWVIQFHQQLLSPKFLLILLPHIMNREPINTTTNTRNIEIARYNWT